RTSRSRSAREPAARRSTASARAGSGEPREPASPSPPSAAGPSHAASPARRQPQTNARRRRRRSQLPTSIVRVPTRRNWTREELAAGVRDGDRRALARAISLVEDGDPLAYGVVADLYPDTGSAYSVGVTGPPGVGKSSLVSALIRHVQEKGSSVGVVS